MADDDFHVMRDLADLLRDIPQWHLPAQTWTDVIEGLRAVAAALDAADVVRLGKLVVELEFISPLRLGTRPGPIPLPVPDEVNVLIHEIELKLSKPDDKGEPEEAGLGDGGR